MSCTVSLVEYKTYNSDGSVSYDFLPKPKLWYTAEDIENQQTKESVDSGSFEPGLFRINPYERTMSRYQAGSGQSSYVAPRAGGKYQQKVAEGCFGAVAFPPDLFEDLFDMQLERDRDLVVQAAMAKVNASAFSGGEELGELRDTLRMLNDPLRGLRSFLSNRRNWQMLRACARNSRSPGLFLKRFGKTVADCWLEIRYGWRPLIYSLTEAMELVERARDRCENLPIKRARSKRTHEDIHYDGGRVRIGWYHNKTLDVKYKASIRSVVFYREFFPRSHAQVWGYSYEYAPEILYNLTRLTFVLDWVLSVNQWLGSYRVKPGIRILGNTVSRRCSVDGVATLRATSDSSSTTYYYEGTDTTYTAESYYREINRKLPSTPLFLGTSNLDFYKVVDALFLAYKPIYRLIRNLYRS